MKRWNYSILLAICMFSVGCGQGEEVEKEKEPIKVISLSITPKVKEEEMEEEVEEEVEEVSGTIRGMSDGFPINTEIVIDTEACNTMNRKLTRDMDSGASLFSVDKNEVVYFVNQNYDNYLYCIKEGMVELAVDLPVKEVYPWDDVVYFMIASKELEGKKEGDIYCYIPETKEVKLVYALETIEETQNHKMMVNEQGIHFNYSQMITKEGDITRMRVYSYTLPFGARQPIKDTAKLGKAGWGEYYFSYEFNTNNSIEPVKLSLVNRTKGKSDTIPLEIGDFQYCVMNDKIYSMGLGSTILSVFDLQTRKKSVYNFREDIIKANAYLKEEIGKSFGEGIEEFVSFTATENGNVLWITDGEYLYRMDINERYIDFMETKDENRRIDKLYTDGRRVYGLYSSERTGTTSLVRFCTEVIEQEALLTEYIIEVEYLVSSER